MYGTGTRIDQWSGIESIGTVKNIDIYTYIYIHIWYKLWKVFPISRKRRIDY